MQNNLKKIKDKEKNTSEQTVFSLIKKTFQQVYNKELPLDHLVFLYTAVAGILMSIFGLGYNMSQNIGIYTLPVLLLYLVTVISSVLYSIVKKRWHGAAVIVLGSSAFLLIPFLWFTLGGVTGSTPPIMFTAGICIAIVFKGALRSVMLALQAIMLVAFIALEFHFPDIIIPYTTRIEQFSDLAFGLTMSFLANTILIYTVVGQYVKARDEKTRLVHRLEYLSLTDALTGLYNRRFLSASIDEEMRRAYDTGSQLTLCILDIDHFKIINDTYGHDYGDEVLFNIAQIMNACLTEGELFGRYGGEEFVVLFPGQTPREALPKVRALADHIRTHGWTHGKPVTISGGLSSYVKGISYSDFIEAADKNLYCAKREGRDKIIYR
ncbi:MAG TPA: GGDEF domain-containing protein [Clostridiaceae bacterium]|jgi:diguanylate cyclase (GGDEF)-like protein|nr:GGDEF domain-containing protein [Clostridiaceae bacterium]